MKANTSPIQSTQRGTFNEWLVERAGWKGLTDPVPAHANTIWYLLGGISFVGVLILFAPGSYFLRAVTEEGETATAGLTISVSAEQMSTKPMEASAEPPCGGTALLSGSGLQSPILCISKNA